MLCFFFQRDLAKLLFQMGAVKSALDIFYQIHAWEDVVYCYQSLGWHAKVTLRVTVIFVFILIFLYLTKSRFSSGVRAQ